MKQTVIQCITAMICVIAIAVTTIQVSSKISEAKILIDQNKAAEEETSADAANSNSADASAGTSTGTATADTTATGTATADATATGTATADTTATGTATADTTATGTATTGSTGTTTTTPAPSTKAEIAAYYNAALNKAISSKAGYTKARATKLGSLEGAEAIMKIKVAADAVNDFLGVGTTNYTNKKGEAKYLSTAALTANDISSATCTGTGTYTITINLVNGNSAMPGNTDTSPLKRSGLYCGAGDKTDYDYKNAENIYTGLNNADGASVKSVRETTKNAKIIALVDAATGNLKALKVSYDWEAGLTDVKYVVTLKGEKIGYASTAVVINSFQY